MPPTRWLHLAAVLVLVVSASTAVAQDGLDPHTMDAFGGTYLADCAKESGPRLTILRGELVFLEGSKRISGRNVMSAASYYGPNMPDTYRTTILSELAGGDQLIAVLHEDAGGKYATLDGAPAVLARVSPAMRTHKFRLCGSAAPKPTQAPAPAPAAPGAAAPKATGEGVTASGMLLDRKFKSLYLKTLGPLAKESWLADLDGPSTETRRVKVGGVEYLLVNCCKSHDCGDNNMVLLYSAPLRKVYGHVHRSGRTTLFGAPTPALARELRTFWQAQWRANP